MSAMSSISVFHVQPPDPLWRLNGRYAARELANLIMSLLDTIVSVLPQSEGLLPKWMLFVRTPDMKEMFGLFY